MVLLTGPYGDRLRPFRHTLLGGNCVSKNGTHRGAKGRPLGFQLVRGPETDSSPLYMQLYGQLRDHILGGALPSGASLPSARMLSADLSVSRNTVEAAYSQLQAEGFITRRVGAGTVVAPSAEGTPLLGTRAAKVNAPSKASAVGISLRGAELSQRGRAEADSDRTMGACPTDVSNFPGAVWNRVLTRKARRGGLGFFRPADAQGLLSLRKAIVEHVQVTRGVVCDASQVIVVNSTQQGLDLAARVLLDPGDTAYVENPGYRSAWGAFVAAGAHLSAIPVDNEGLDASYLPRNAGRSVLYLTPSHQFPLGVTMTLARRLAILRWAKETGSWILEDDYDSEFRYDGRPLAALQGLDRDGQTLYIGTWNKIVFPGLRLAYIIVPPALVDAFVGARRMTDGPANPLLQSALAEFISGGYLAAHIRQARRSYAARRDLLIGALHSMWGDAVRIGPSSTGLHLVAHFPDHFDDVAVAAGSPSELGLGIAPLSRYFATPEVRRGLILNYGAVPPANIARAIHALTPAVLRPGTERSRQRSPSLLRAPNQSLGASR